MLARERQQNILSRIVTFGKVLVSEEAVRLGVSEETVRRDLEKLHAQGKALKIHGGAVKNDDPFTELPLHIRREKNVAAKQKIAEKIALEICDGDYLALDASSTALCVVQQILHKKDITVITNSLEILLSLSHKTNWTVISTGGTLKESTLSLVGRSARECVQNYRVDRAICSCKGLDISFGASDTDEADAEIKRAFFAAAEHKILGVDATKFEKRSFVNICPLSFVDFLFNK